MRDWVLENTSVTKKEYDNVIDTYQILEEFLRTKTDYTTEQRNRILKRFVSGVEKNNRPEDKIINMIEFFTLNYNSISNLLLSIKTGIFRNGDHFIYKGYTFNLLSSIYTKYAKELTSKNRYHKCHEVALRELFDLDVDYYYLAKVNDRKGSKCLHSFVTKGNDVYDYALNLIMPIDMYFKLLDVEVVNKITRQDLIDKLLELNEYNDSKIEINIPEFCAWPDQILMSLKKRD